jgi:hypothetical protein
MAYHASKELLTKDITMKKMMLMTLLGALVMGSTSSYSSVEALKNAASSIAIGALLGSATGVGSALVLKEINNNLACYSDPLAYVCIAGAAGFGTLLGFTVVNERVAHALSIDTNLEVETIRLSALASMLVSAALIAVKNK